MVSNIFYAGNLALKITFSIIGTVGVLDNLFVIIVFIFFIKIADKVTCSLITFNNTQTRPEFESLYELISRSATEENSA